MSTVESPTRSPDRRGSGSRPQGSVVEPPAPPALADHLARSQQARGYYGTRLVERFRRLGADRYGLWFEFIMSLPVSELTAEDKRFIGITWHQFTNGQQPFARRRARL